MVDYSGSIGRAWKYSTNVQRLASIFLMMLVASVIAISPLLLVYKTVSLGIFNLMALIQTFVWLLVGIVVGLLVFLYATLLFTHNYANQKSLRKSAGFAFSNYPKFLAVIIVTGIITFVLSLAPFIGFILTIVAGLIFFFAYQEVAFRSSFSNTLKNSYNIFLENKLDTVITFIVTGVFAFIIIVIFAIPLFAVGIMSVASAMTTGAFMQAFMSNLGALVAAGLVLLLGLAFAVLFTNSIKTDVYMQLKKKKR